MIENLVGMTEKLRMETGNEQKLSDTAVGMSRNNWE